MTNDSDGPKGTREHPAAASGNAAKKWSIDDDDMWAALRMQIRARRARLRAGDHCLDPPDSNPADC